MPLCGHFSQCFLSSARKPPALSSRVVAGMPVTHMPVTRASSPRSRLRWSGVATKVGFGASALCTSSTITLHRCITN
eukprot:scaffold145379_cov175-Phaeocystis_antarctica.AAC.1